MFNEVEHKRDVRDIKIRLIRIGLIFKNKNCYNMRREIWFREVHEVFSVYPFIDRFLNRYNEQFLSHVRNYIVKQTSNYRVWIPPSRHAVMYGENSGQKNCVDLFFVFYQTRRYFRLCPWINHVYGVKIFIRIVFRYNYRLVSSGRLVGRS